MSAKSSKRVLGGREKVKVAIVQKSPVFMNREASVARACDAIEEAGRDGAHLVVFPEAWLAGYPYWTEGWDSPLPQWAGGGYCSGTTHWSCRARTASATRTLSNTPGSMWRSAAMRWTPGLKSTRYTTA